MKKEAADRRATKGTANQRNYGREGHIRLTMEDLEMYEILGVNPNDTFSQIKTKYRKLLQKFHTDKTKLDNYNAVEKVKP